MSEALRLRAVERVYRTEAGALPVLRGVDLALPAGEIVALVAPSGTGKSTLLHLAGLLEKPDAGQVLIDGRDAGALSDAERTAMMNAARLGVGVQGLGLAGRVEHLPGKLSGGEQQRVAIARALANGPALLLADEPTGNLDVQTAAAVFDELLASVRGQGLAALIATHNPDLAARMDRTVTLRDGRLVDLA